VTSLRRASGHTGALSRIGGGRHLVGVQITPQVRRTGMDVRFDLFGNELALKFAKRFANASMVIQQSSLPTTIQELVSLRASQINGCGWCADMHTKEAAAHGESAVRLNLVATWRESTVFTEAERAALALAEEGTRMADASLGVSDETWEQVRKHFDDDQTAALVVAVAMINAANRLAVIVHQKGGSYEPGMFAAMLDS
jgi:AhpD family alkylhydroperoxidase